MIASRFATIYSYQNTLLSTTYFIDKRIIDTKKNEILISGGAPTFKVVPINEKIALPRPYIVINAVHNVDQNFRTDILDFIN